MPDRLFARLPIERILLFATLALGALHAWFGRYSMNPDGISYLDVGDSFFRRDWANAVNAGPPGKTADRRRDHGLEPWLQRILGRPRAGATTSV